MPDAHSVPQSPPQPPHMAAAAPVAQLHHATGSHGGPTVQPGAHQHTTNGECPACIVGHTNHPLPKEVIEMMASREHRMHHWLWHEVRNNWHRYPRDIQQKIDELGWKPPRPVLDESGNPNLENDAGEDFLYMHRQMIGDVNAILKQVGDLNYPRVQGWLEAPAPDDTSYPVPPAWFDPTAGQAQFTNIKRIKSDIFYEKRFRFWQKIFLDPVFLRSVTLGKLGVIMEMTIHNAMHMRWAASSGTVRPDPLQATGDIDPTKGEVIGVEWDDPRYDFLGDTYSSHVNPIFWKLHGWIDDRVEAWKLANGIFGNNFWKATWTGKMPGHEEMAAPHALHGGPEHVVSPMAESQQVANLIAKSGVFHNNPFMPSFSIEAW